MFDDDEDDYDPRAEFKRIKNLPVFKKAEELCDLVDRMLKGVSIDDLDATEWDKNRETNDFKKHLFESNRDHLYANSMIIPAKIAGAEGVEIYDIKMESAAIIRKAARELITDARGLQMNGFTDVEYLDLLRNEVEAFRVIFAEWVNTFDPTNFMIDRWNVFNPPGVSYDDHDPDDDIPFNPMDFLPDDL
jgi:hypothetical protein